MSAASKLPPAIFLMGPTAGGKTALAFTLADQLPVELVSVDSAQVYRDMNIGTAKPDSATLARYPHHLIDLLSPEARYSVAQFRDDAIKVMAEITVRGRIPLLVGGTMLYFRTLLQGLSELPGADVALRAAIGDEATLHGWPALHAALAKIDPVTAARLAPTDSQRIQRALEIFRLTGEAPSMLYARQTTETLPYRLIQLALVPSDRSVLHARIEQRFDAMLEMGLIEEVESLRKHYELDPELPSMRSVGYRQVWDFLEGKDSKQAMRDKGIYATRQLAKRQLTWLRSMNGLTVLDSLDSAHIDQAMKLVVDATHSQD